MSRTGNMLTRFLRGARGAIALPGLLIFLATAAKAATGDITSVTIDTNGWNCFVVFSGMGTNSPTFNNGMGGIIVDGQCLVTNVVDPLTAKFKLWVSSPGFDATGTSNWTTRAVFGTKMVRKAYPNQALPDTSSSGGNATVNIALSEHIATNDVVSWDIAANTYVQSAVGNNASTGSCVNNTLLGYPKTILNLLDYSWNAETNSVMTVRAFAYEQHGHSGRPVVDMLCTVSNILGQSWSSNITVMECDRGRNGTEILPQGQYVARVPLSGFTQGSKLIVQWKAFPWIGNAASLANTGDGTHIMPSANAAPITNVCDKNITYSKVCFVVDPAGNDANGRCRIDGDPTAITSGQYFATIGAALNIATTSNSTYFSHADTSGVNGYLRTGAHTYCMTAKAYGPRPDVLPTLQPYPGDSGVIISNSAANTSSQPTMIRFKNLTFNMAPSVANWLSTSNNNWAAWVFDGCTLSNMNSAQISAGSSSQSYSLIYFVDCAIPKWGQGIICQGGGAKDTYALLRGCNLTGFTNKIMAGTMLGNYVTATNAGPNFYQLVSDTASQGSEIVDPQINYNNFWGCMQLNSSAVLRAANFTITNGYFDGNNIYEFVTNANLSSSARFDLGSTEGKNITNMCMIGNVYVGATELVAYNADTTAPSWRIWEKRESCYSDNPAFKTETFTGGASGANGNRIGNWSVMYGVGFSCNVVNDTSGFTAGAGSFKQEFCGLNTIGVNINNGDTAGGRTDMCGARVGFANRKSWDGSTVNTGNGNYNWTANSLVHRIQRLDVQLPFDIWGNQRGDMSPIGALSEGDLNK